MKLFFKNLWIAVLVCFSFLVTACTGLNGSNSDDKAGTVTATNPTKFVPGTTSTDMAAKMTIGWNLGNTFDATGKAGVACENQWGQPTTTKEMLQGLHDSGFVSIRIPVSWHDHITDSTNFTIEEEWINRVKEVVGWAQEAGLCVIINMHHDNLSNTEMESTDYGYAVSNVPEVLAKSKKYIEKVWANVAEAFKDYDHTLVFELLNEPRDVNGEMWNDEWNISGDAAKVANEIITSYEQIALDIVRASGSKNADRFILVPPYAASPNCMNGFELPKDSATSRLMVETHGYTPYSFAMQPGKDGGTSEFTTSHESEINYMLTNLNTKFVSNDVGVVMDEMGATNKDNLDERIKWAKYYFSTAKEKGITCFWWDNGDYKADKNGTEKYGYYNRTEQIWYFPELMKASLSAVGISTEKLD